MYILDTLFKRELEYTIKGNMKQGEEMKGGLQTFFLRGRKQVCS